MKILTVYNKKTGELVFTQTNATEEYSCIVEEIEDNKEVIGVDLSTNKCILADKLATTEEKKKLENQLLNKENENEKLIDEIINLKAENLLLKMEE